MIRYRAAWVLPIASPPIRNAWVQVDDGRIVAVGTGHDPTVPERHLGDTALLPGLVNAHTHLELSYLRDQVPPADDFVTWIRGVMGSRAGPGNNVHQQITNMWSEFQRSAPNASRSSIEMFAAHVDRMFAGSFWKGVP